MSVLLIDLKRVYYSKGQDYHFYSHVINFDLPNFHSMSDCC